MPTTRQPKGRLYTLSTLRDKGIKFVPNHIRRLVKKGRFPRPLYLGAHTPAWTESSLDEWLEGLEETERKRGADIGAKRPATVGNAGG
jgi:hypothetical protein